MNKGLREQIKRYMPEMVGKLRKDALEQAEKDFIICCEKIEKGDFSMVEEDQIRVFALNAGTSGTNNIWKKAYDEKLSELFRNEGLEILNISRDFSCNCASVYLKI